MHDIDDRFGSDRALRAAMASHGADNPMVRMGMYVPTRGEVASLPPDELSILLDLWIWESPTELISSYAQIREVRETLATRSDAHQPEVRALIAVCDDYVDSEGET